jgi:hypothetical protein
MQCPSPKRNYSFMKGFVCRENILLDAAARTRPWDIIAAIEAKAVTSGSIPPQHILRNHPGPWYRL